MKMECIEINWLYKHTKNVRSSRASISWNSCTVLSKTQFSLRVSLNRNTSDCQQVCYVILVYNFNLSQIKTSTFLWVQFSDKGYLLTSEHWIFDIFY